MREAQELPNIVRLFLMQNAWAFVENQARAKIKAKKKKKEDCKQDAQIFTYSRKMQDEIRESIYLTAIDDMDYNQSVEGVEGVGGEEKNSKDRADGEEEDTIMEDMFAPRGFFDS